MTTIRRDGQGGGETDKDEARRTERRGEGQRRGGTDREEGRRIEWRI